MHPASVEFAAPEPAARSRAARKPVGVPAPPARPRKINFRPTVVPVPDEPIAVTIAGGDDTGRGALLGALLGAPGPLLTAGPGSYLVVRYGTDRGIYPQVPGNRYPERHRSLPTDGPQPAARPARRIDMSLPDPLLRHFALVEAPDTRHCGLAGTRVLVDVAKRGGAVVYVLAAGRPATSGELDTLAALLAAEVRIFLVVTPDADGRWVPPRRRTGPAPRPGRPARPARLHRLPADRDPVTAALAAHRSALTAALPALGDARWFALDPSAGDTAYLRRSLIEWAGIEGLQRASDNPPDLPGSAAAARVADTAHLSDWSDRLTAMCRAAAHGVRQQLAVELANIHLRCVQDIVFGAGCAALPEFLDRELHALSLRAVGECEVTAARVVEESLALVVVDPAPGVRRRMTEAVRRSFDTEPAEGDLARALMITMADGVAAVIGNPAVSACWAYDAAGAPLLLPPVGIGLAAGCYEHWRLPANDDADRARSWLQRTLRGVELELVREVSRRFDALDEAIGTILAEAVDHGILLR